MTETGMRAALCANPWLKELRACAGDASQVIELPARMIGDPGLGMLDAAEALHERVLAGQKRQTR